MKLFRSKFRFFSVIDHEISDHTDGLYKYRVELKFEDIANDFSKTYNELCLFLNIKHIPNILSQTNFNFKKAHIGRWKHELSMEEQEDLNNYFSELLALLGYQ